MNGRITHRGKKKLSAPASWEKDGGLESLHLRLIGGRRPKFCSVFMMGSGRRDLGKRVAQGGGA